PSPPSCSKNPGSGLDQQSKMNITSRGIGSCSAKSIASMKRIVFIFLIACAQLAASSQILQGKNAEASKTSTAKSKPAKPAPPPPPDPPKPVVIPTPDFINQPYYYDSSNNKLITLETTAAQLVTKKKTLGL